MSHPLETQKRFKHQGFRNALTVLIFAVSYSLQLWTSVSLPFLLKLPSFECASHSSTFIPCQRDKYCSLLAQSPELTRTSYPFSNYIKDFSLECEPPSTTASFGSYLFIGYLLSALLCTLQSNFGSYKLALFSYLLHIGSLSASLVVSSHSTLALLHLVIGLRATSLALFSYGRLIDYINPDKAAVYGSYMAAFEGVVSLVISTYFLFFQSWRVLVIVQIFIGFLLLIVNLIFMTEPPTWLYSKGKYEESNHALTKIAKLFGQNIEEIQKQLKNESTQNPQNEEKQDIIKLPKTQDSKLKTVVIVLCFFMINVIFYGKSMTIKQIKANINLLAIIDGTMGTLGHLISSSLTFLSESSTVVGMSLMCASACFFMQFVQFMQMHQFLQLLLMSSISLTTPVIYNFLNIIFFKIYRIEERPLPTLLTNLIGKIGAFAAVYLVEYAPSILFFTFGLLALGLGGQGVMMRDMLPKVKSD